MSECVCDGSGLMLASLFDGIAGFPLAFSRAGVPTVATVEIDKAAAGVAADHFPQAKHFADITEVTPDDLLGAGFCPVHGVLSAGWPCTDLSLAGLRLGLGGARSGLVGEVFRLLLGLRSRWFVLENVPGLLSSVCPCPGGGVCSAPACADGPHPVRGGSCGRSRGRDGRVAGNGRCMALHGGGMGTVLRRLGECGYGLAYRVLDAQSFGVPQRRRRVVIVGRLGDWAGPAEVLLEPEGMPRHPRPGGAAGAVAAALTRNGVGGGGGADDNAGQAGHLIATTLTAREGKGPDSDATTTLVTHALTAEGHDASGDGTGRGTPIVPVDLAQVTSWANRSNPQAGDPAYTLTSSSQAAVAFGHKNGIDVQASATAAPAMRAESGGGAVGGMAGVRRLTPTECERLQGFPDGWTATSHGREQADSPRYRQLGNSIAVPVFTWVARRMVAVDRGERP